MRLLWIRHGQMELRASVSADPGAINRIFNQEEQGGLSARGQREAELVAARLEREGVDALYSSPLVRASETAEVSGRRLGMEITITPAITELRTGHLADESRAAAWVRWMSGAPIPAPVKRTILGGSLIPLYFQAWQRGRTVGGESPAELDARIEAFLAELEARHSARATIALFAHGYLIFTLAQRLSRSPVQRARFYARPYIPNGGFTEMELARGALRLVRYADARHLAR